VEEKEEEDGEARGRREVQRSGVAARGALTARPCSGTGGETLGGI